MNDCLTRLLGLRGCTDGSEPFQINDIGYSREQFEEFIDDSFANVDDFFEALRRQAAMQVTSDIVSKMPKSVKAFTGLENRSVGALPENRQTVTQTGNVGIRFDLHNRHELMKLRITSLRLFVDFTDMIQLEVRNLNTGELLRQVPVEVVAGEMTSVPVDIEIKSKRENMALWIGYDSTGLGDAYKVQLSTRGCKGCSGRDSQSAFVLTRMQALESPFIVSATSQLTHTGGLMFDYVIECDFDAYACSLAGYLGLPLMYKTALLLLEYGLKSGGQFSHQKTTNAENNDERYMQAQYHYDNEMKKALANMKFPVNRCFTCNTATEIYTRLPG